MIQSIRIRLQLKGNSYPIVIGINHLNRIGRELKKIPIGRDAILISSAPILKLHGKKITKSLEQTGFSLKVIRIADSERSKSTGVAVKVLNEIAEYDRKKKIFLIAFGGGVVGDLTGFVAAVYKRGIPYIQVPTTFLGQIDSAIGGKTAVDLEMGKNLVGAFYQPQMVFSDVSALSTLSSRQIRNGLAEAIKYGVISDRDLFVTLEKKTEKLIHKDEKALFSIVRRCSRIKARVVEKDTKETKGIRTILNFGHTIGHAIETAAGYQLYHHGEAVALGMRVACDIALRLGMLNSLSCQRIHSLISACGLPQSIDHVSLRQILSIMQHDKKFLNKKNRFVLPVAIGRVKVIEGVPRTVIKKAVQNWLAK